MKFFKQCAAALVGLSLFATFGAPFAHAGDLILGGQKHEYKVILRGDGRAIVIGKLTIPNTSSESLDIVNVGLSVSDADQITAYQVVVPQTCSAWSNTVSGTSTINTCTKYKEISSKDLTNAPYSKIEVKEDSENSYALELPTAIAPGMSAVVLFAYTSKEYTNSFLGLISYKFVTPTVEERIESMNVSIQTDSDLEINGGSTTIEYGTTTGSFEVAASLSSADSLSAAISTKSGNTVRESATNLFPGESYTVEGKYSEYWWRLYLGRVLAVVIVLGAIIAFVAWKNRGANREKIRSLWMRFVNGIFGGAVTSGLISAALIGLWTAFVTESNFTRYIDGDVAEALSFLVIAMVFLLVGVGPSVVAGSKRGWKAGVGTFVSTIIWLVVGIVVMGILQNNDRQVFPEFMNF
ncbi:MAG: hypothetical protein AAB839_01920 [Patescibacteria group bacterium]